jgi:hypothetical protein
MSGRGIGDLGKPEQRYRMDLGFSAKRSGLEKLGKCQDEDLTRERRLRWAAKRHPDVIDAKAALALADKLEAAGEGRKVPESLASSVYMRGQRINVAGALWKLIRESR